MQITCDAGRIPRDWLEDCRINESEGDTLEHWLSRALNVEECEVDADGSVSVQRSAGSGHEWLTQDAIDRALATIDRGC